MSIEVGIQNSGFGLVLVFNFFDGLGGMAIVAAWWGILHIVSGLALAANWGFFLQYVGRVVAVVFAMNGLGLLVGYWLMRISHFGKPLPTG